MPNASFELATFSLLERRDNHYTNQAILNYLTIIKIIGYYNINSHFYNNSRLSQ